MRILKTKEAIFNHIPKITDDDYKEMNKAFTPYLFFRDHRKEGYRECWCSSCQKHFTYDFIQRTEAQGHRDFISAKHNEYIVCPECGKTAIAKETYRAKQCSTLKEWKRIVLVKHRSKNEVYLLCYFGNKDYLYCDYLTKPEYYLSVVYYLTPGSVRSLKKEYDYTYLGINDNDFHEIKSICEPFTKTWWYNISDIDKRGYNYVGLKNLKNTFIEYAPLDLFDDEYEKHFYRAYACRYSSGETPIVKFLCYYALYPSTEKLLKIGLGEFVCKLIDGTPMKRYINWNAELPKDMFKMDKAQFKNFREHYYGPIDFKVYQLLLTVKKDISYSTVTELIKDFAGESAVRVAQKIKQHNLNITHTFNYVRKNTFVSTKHGKDSFDYERTAIMWTDYLTFAQELKYDLTRDDVIFPKDLEKAHGQANANITVKKDEKAFEKYKKRYEKLQNLYEYSDGTYCIVIPRGINDIIEEGKILHHCVKGYASRHIEGKTTILFMRRCNRPNTRLITIEVNDSGKRIIQNRGECNRSLTKDEQAFVDEWIAWVKAGSKRNKKEKSAEEAA